MSNNFCIVEWLLLSISYIAYQLQCAYIASMMFFTTEKATRYVGHEWPLKAYTNTKKYHVQYSLLYKGSTHTQ